MVIEFERKQGWSQLEARAAHGALIKVHKSVRIATRRVRGRVFEQYLKESAINIIVVGHIIVYALTDHVVDKRLLGE